MALLFLALFTLVFGLLQGIIVWLLTEFVPPRYLAWIDAALHKGGVLLYALLVATVATYAHVRTLGAAAQLLALALLVRVVLFDPALNLARAWVEHRERHQPLRWQPWSVGTSASSDRLVVKLADLLGGSPAHLRELGWAVAACLLLLYC